LLGAYDSKAGREKYDRFIAEWLANGRRADYRRVDGVTVSRVIAEFWAHAKRYYAGSAGVRGSEADNFRVAVIPSASSTMQLSPPRSWRSATACRPFGALFMKLARAPAC